MTGRERNPNIEDVARHAGVSRAAVSKVLRDAYGVSDTMRSTVQASIDFLQYRPRLGARTMRGSSYTIGVVLPTLESPFFADVVDGVAESLDGTPFQIIFTSTQDESRARNRAVESLVDRQVDGLVVCSPLVDRSWLEGIAARTPMVTLARHDRSRNYDALVGDDAAGIGLVFAHLVELGHREIAHITQRETAGAQVLGTPHAIRRATYRRLMREAGLVERITVIDGRYEEGPSYAATLAAFARGLRPTAILAGADEAAFGVLRALTELPEEVAGRVAVTGYDNTRFARHPRMSVTSVDQAGHQMGQRAAALLLERIGGRTAVVHESVAPTLFARRSSLAPAI